jgi:hypothetical protein
MSVDSWDVSGRHMHQLPNGAVDVVEEEGVVDESMLDA